MTVQLWLDTAADETIDLGVDGLRVYTAFADMAHACGEDYDAWPDLFGVIDAAEEAEDVDPAWLARVRAQAREFLEAHEGDLGPDALTVLDALAAGLPPGGAAG